MPIGECDQSARLRLPRGRRILASRCWVFAGEAIVKRRDRRERPPGRSICWLRERHARLYVDLLTEAHAEQAYLAFLTSSDTAREQMREVSAATDTRLPPWSGPGLAQAAPCSAAPQCAGARSTITSPG